MILYYRVGIAFFLFCCYLNAELIFFAYKITFCNYSDSFMKKKVVILIGMRRQYFLNCYYVVNILIISFFFSNRQSIRSKLVKLCLITESVDFFL